MKKTSVPWFRTVFLELRGKLYVLSLCVLILALPQYFSINQQGEVELHNVVLPQTCAFKYFFGIDCPGCGLTRSFIMLFRLDFVQSWHYNSVGIFIFLYVLLQIPARTYLLFSPDRKHDRFNVLIDNCNKVILFVLTANWIIKLYFNKFQ